MTDSIKTMEDKGSNKRFVGRNHHNHNHKQGHTQSKHVRVEGVLNDLHDLFDDSSNNLNMKSKQLNSTEANVEKDEEDDDDENGSKLISAISEWDSLAWVINKPMLEKFKSIQHEFLSSPNRTSFRPQPVIYRPLLPTIGWGNMYYDICHNFILAVILERPFLMSFDKKDPTGSIDSLLEPKEIDWRYSSLHHHSSAFQSNQGKRLQHHHLFLNRKFDDFKMDDEYDLDYFQKRLSSPTHEQISCRSSHKWFDLCGKSSSRGNLDKVYPILKTMPEKVLYSEFSESIIMPIRNSKTFINFINDNLAKVRRFWSDLAIICRFVFNFLFRPSRILRDSLLKIQARLGSNYVVSHVRTGHLEDGEQRTKENSLQQMVEALSSCRNTIKQQKWLLLTDDLSLALEAKRQNISEITISDEDLVSNAKASAMHTGKAHTVYNSAKRKEAFQAALKAWTLALTDWLVIVQAPSLVFLHNRMPTAGTFGMRAAYVGGHACAPTGNSNVQIPNAPPPEVWK